MIQACDNGGAQLHYETFGGDRDTLVLLIAGAGAPAEYWPQSFCEALAARQYQVVRFWHRDTGQSTHFDEPYSIDLLIDDVLAILDSRACETAHLVGHSMGGYIAQLISTRHPGRVLSCIALAAGPLASEKGKQQLGLSSPDEALWPKLMENLPKGDFDRDLPGWMASWQLLNGQLDIEQDLARAYTRALYSGPASNHQAAENHIHAMTTVADCLAADLGKCDVPILYIHGEFDPLVPPDHGAKAAELARYGALEILPDAGHMYFNRHIWDRIETLVAKHCARADQT